jgi:hypothetical protein
VAGDAGVFAATALLTLLIGLATGVVSAWRSVAARVNECRGLIGVRVALGAERGTVVWMIVRDGLAIAVSVC